MPTATLTLPAAPEQARTARLVAGVAARRAGVDPDSLDDVRLAVAEAVARAVLRSVADGQARADRVSVSMTDDGQSFAIEVVDRASARVVADDDFDEELSLSMMRSLAADSRVEDSYTGGRKITLSWPTTIA